MRQRRAIRRATEIIAECPLEAVCICKVDGVKNWIRCGYYDGTVRHLKSFLVVCKYIEK
jgi:hypothetical protein